MAKNWDYEYTPLKMGERQYDDIDLAVDKIVQAKYVDTYVHRGNPFIEALPFAKTADEVRKGFNCVPSLPPADVFKKVAPQIQDMYLSQVLKYRIALPFHEDVEAEFSRTILESYSSRKQIERPNDITVDGNTYKTPIVTKAFHAGEATNGFAMLGVAGAGKTTALNMVLDHYPQVIIHEFGDEKIVQIVYLLVTCAENSNFSTLYENIGVAIDEALNNGNKAVQEEIVKIRVGGLGAKASKVRELIEKYSIGIIIFDEVQNIDLTSTRENSIEALLRLNNETHVGLGVMGTEEAFDKLFSKDRTMRRLSSYIAAGRYCNNPTTFSNIVSGIFISQIFDNYVIPDTDIIQAFYDESAGVIAYVVWLYYYVLKDYKDKKKKPEITAEYIRKISASKRAIIHKKIYKHKKSTKQSEVARRRLISEMNSYGNDEEQRSKDAEFDGETNRSGMFWKANAIKTLAEQSPEIDKKRIEVAVSQAIGFGAESEADLIEKAGKILEEKKNLPRNIEKTGKIVLDTKAILKELYSTDEDE